MVSNNCNFGLMVTLFLTIPSFVVLSITKRYVVEEEEELGTKIGLLGRDLEITRNEDLETRFRFIDQPNVRFLNLRETDGELSVAQMLDREQLCHRLPHCLILLDVVAVHNGSFHLIHVELEVRDINDNYPIFPFNETYIEIHESATIGTRFPLDIASDQDVGRNYIQSYQISSNNHFEIEVRIGEDGGRYAELVLVKELDREVRDSHTLKVTAIDGGRPPKSGTVLIHIEVLDVNDNYPTFENSSFKVELYEDTKVGVLLLQLHASDPDDGTNGQIVYGFMEQAPPEIKEMYKIDPHSGRLTLERALDYENDKNYELKIQAYDLGLNSVPAVCTVTVEVLDVNDNAPDIKITPFQFDRVAHVSESTAEGSFMALVSTSDRDSDRNGHVRCSLHGHEHFKLQPVYGDTFVIMTTAILDRENISEYNLAVIAEDMGSPPFRTTAQCTVRVEDENDNAPIFSQAIYEVFIEENNVVGALLATVSAHDLDLGQNADITYKLVDAKGNEQLQSTFVSVDPVSGSLYSARSFDYELTQQIEVHIQAHDHGSPRLSTTTLVRIKVRDTNDNAPLITHPASINGTSLTLLPSDVPTNVPVLRIKAQDADEGRNGQLTHLISDDKQKIFSLNEQTGDLFLRSTLKNNSEKPLQIEVHVRDNGLPSLSSKINIIFIVTTESPSDDKSECASETNVYFEYKGLVVSEQHLMIIGSCAFALAASLTISFFYKTIKRRGYYNTSNATHQEASRYTSRASKHSVILSKPFEFICPGEAVFVIENASGSLRSTGWGEPQNRVRFPHEYCERL